MFLHIAVYFVFNKVILNFDKLIVIHCQLVENTHRVVNV